MLWALNSTDTKQKTRKKKKKGYEMNTKSSKLKLKNKSEIPSSNKTSKPKKVLKLSKFNDYITSLKTLRAQM